MRHHEQTPARPIDSLSPDYFDQKYAERLDYWNFETSSYEAAKYAQTVAALPQPAYRYGLEIGCSIGVLTAQLAPRCGQLLAVDVAERALAVARQRCPQVEFARLRFPRERPAVERFDLVVLSEVGYYWSRAELALAQRLVCELLEPEGDLILVHWTPESTDYPLTGREVHASFLAQAGLKHLRGHEGETYRLDVLRRVTV